MLSTMPTTHPSPQDLYSLFPRWHVKRRNASFMKRLGMRFLELLFVTAAMFVFPTVINRVVQSFDSFHELMGRRARSPFEESVPWGSVVVVMGLMLGWHVWLGLLSYQAVLERRESGLTKIHEKRVERKMTWGIALGRAGVPLLLIVYGFFLVHQVVGRLGSPLPLIVWESEGQDANFEAGRQEL